MKAHTTWLVANWKMNGNESAVRQYAHAINTTLMMAPATLACVFCPPMPYLGTVADALPQNARLRLGAQNCHMEDMGAFTGEVSAAMLAEIGCDYVVIGHSERRAMGETDAMVARKAEAAIAAGLIPIICIGESQAQYEAKETMQVLNGQLAAIAALSSRRLLIAYEPVWAIGSGLTPAPAEISAAHRHIKTVLGSETPVLYGGSVNAGNAKEILSLPEVSGALIGGASLNIASMRDIIAAARG